MATPNIKLKESYPYTYIIHNDSKDNGNPVIELMTFNKKCTDKDIKIPSQIDGIPVKIIGEALFTGTKIESVQIPDSIISIRRRAFYNCKLKDVYIPDSVKFIRDDAFGFCRDLKTVRWSNRVTRFDPYVFYNCEGLESITNIDNVEEIKKWAFAFSGIKTFSIPNKCGYVGENSFAHCVYLLNVDIPPSVSFMASDVFEFSKKVRLNICRNPIIKDWAELKGLQLAAPRTSEINSFFEKLNEDERGEP